MNAIALLISTGRAAKSSRIPRGRKGHRVRARVIVGIGVLAYLLAQAALDVVVESPSSAIGDPLFAEKFRLLQRHPEFFRPTHSAPRLLAIGSSRTLLSFDTKAFGQAMKSSAFNFGCHGCGPITGTLYLRRLFAIGLHTDTVLLELHPAMLADHRLPYESRWLHPYRIKRDEIALLQEYGWKLPTPDQHRRFGWLANSHTYRFSALDRYAPDLSPCPFGLALNTRVDAHGFVRGMDVPQTDRLAALQRECSLYLPALINYRPGGAAVAAIRDAIQLCYSHGVTPVLLLSAESSEFRSWYGPAGQDQFQNWLDHIAHEYPVRIVDTRAWIPDGDLVDGHHPTAAGATAFTNRLVEEFRK